MRIKNTMLAASLLTMFVAYPAMAATVVNVASQGYVDRNLADKADLVAAGTAGAVATVDGAGQYVRSGTALSDLATTSSVNTAINTAITNNNTNVSADLDGKADLQGTGTAGLVATVDADGQYIRSGTALSDLATTSSVNTAINTAITNNNTNVSADLDGKADLQGTGTAGLVATVDADGQYIRSGTALSDLATTSSMNTAINTAITNNNTNISADLDGKADLQVGDTSGNVATMDGAGQYVDSGTALSSLASQTWVNSQDFQTSTDVTNAITNAVTNNITLTGALDGKADLQGTGTAGLVATVDADGQYIRSGTALSDLATTSSMNTAINTAITNNNSTLAGELGLGALATLDAVDTAEIEDDAVTTDKLASDLLKILSELPAECQGADTHCVLSIIDDEIKWEKVAD